MRELRDELKNVRKEQAEMKTYLLDKRIVHMSNSSKEFHVKYNLNLPLKTMEEFSDFIKSLQDDACFKNDVVRLIVSTNIVSFYNYLKIYIFISVPRVN